MKLFHGKRLVSQCALMDWRVNWIKLHKFREESDKDEDKTSFYSILILIEKSNQCLILDLG